MRMKWSMAVAVVSCGILAAWGRAATSEHPARPNVVVIVADDLGYADIGVQGISKDVRTPHIDSIAQNGVRFTNGYVSCPVCSPSRAGFLTGRYQERFGHEANPLPQAAPNFGLPVDQVTFADEMKKAGYATGVIGKWHEGTLPQYWPLKRGFDEFFGFLGGAHSYTVKGQGPNALRRNNEIIPDKEEYLTDAISREAVGFIDRHKAAPFFLYVAYNAVHTPQEAPEKYQERFKDVKDQQRKLMLAMLSAEDDGVGRIVGKLREAGIEEKTLVVFFSDNGGPTGANASSNEPLRGFKGQIWEGGIRIPFMMQWKGTIPARKVKDEPVITLDLMPTALAAAGAHATAKLDGVDLLPWLRGKTDAVPHDTLYWRFSPQWAVRQGDWKLVHTHEGTQLFDLKVDPAEQKDLATQQPDVTKRLLAKFDEWNGQLMEPRWPGKQEGAGQGLKRMEKRKPGVATATDDE